MKQGYLKFSDERNRRFSIKTEIFSDNDTKKVYKYAIFDEGKEHLQHVFDSQIMLKKYYPEVEICQAWKMDDRLEFEFVEGNLLLDCYVTAMHEGNVAEYERLLKFHKSIACGSDENQCDFQESEAFKAWFGSADAYKGTQGMVYSNFDAIAGNVILRGEKPVFIDYEWTMDFVMPQELVVYHCVYDAYLHHPELEEFYPFEKVLDCLEITTDRETLDESYQHFFDYVICDEEGRSYGKDKYLCLKSTFATEYLLEEWQKCAAEWKAAVQANEQLDKELAHAHEEWQKCAAEWENAVKANTELDGELRRLCDECTKSANIVQELSAKQEALQEQYNVLQTQYQNVVNSKWWKLRNKIKREKE